MRSRSTGPLILKWYCDKSLDLNIKQRNLRLRLTRSKFFATLRMNPLIKKMSVHNSRTHSTRALWAERTVLQLGRRVCIVRWVKAWDGVIVVESRHYVNRRNNKLPNQADTITASAFRGFVNLTSNLIRDLRIPEHNGAALAVPCLSHTVWLCIIGLAPSHSLLVSQIMELHKPFVSPSIITGQLASLWFSMTAIGASQGATSDVLWAKCNTSGASASSSNSLSLKRQGHNDVNASAPPSLPCVSVRMTPLFFRFKSIKSDEAKEKEGAHESCAAASSLHMNSSLPNVPFIPWTFAETSIEGSWPAHIAFD